MCELVEQAAEERLELRKEVAELNIAIEKRRQRVLVSESGHCSTSLFCSTLFASCVQYSFYAPVNNRVMEYCVWWNS